MPERHSTGESGSTSSSSRSSWSSSSSHSSSSWSSNHDWNREPSSPEQQALGWIALIVLLVIVGIFWLSDQIKQANQRRDNEAATATTQAITVKDLAEMHAALDVRIPIWKEVQDQSVHRISASDAGFAADSNTKEVNYGYCRPAMFYVYVLESSRPGGWLADTEGYAYTPDSSPDDCHPEGWSIVSGDWAPKDWTFVTIRTDMATYAAQRTATPSTATPAPTQNKQ